MGGVRVRLKFQAPPVRYARQCWFLFDPEQCTVAGDVAFLIAKHFGFKDTHGIQLYMEDFLVPANESADIIRDNDTLVVKAVEDISGTSSDDSSSDEPASKKVRLDSGRTKQAAAIKKKPQSKASTTTPAAPLGLAKTPAAFTAVPVLKVVSSKPSKLGGTHTKFQDSSSSSSSHDEKKEPSVSKISCNITLSSASKKQLRTIPNSAKAQRPKQNTAQGLAIKPSPGKKRRSFPSIVGGPGDVHTTKSVVYQRTADSGPTVVKGKDICKSPPETSNKAEEVATSSKQNDGDQKDSVEKRSEGNHDVCEGTGSKSEAVVDRSPPRLPPKDYSALPNLNGAPRIGDIIAYKVLELSTGYTPEMSPYKEAKVLGYDEPTKMVKLMLTEETLKAEKRKAVKETAGKFSLDSSSTAMDEGSPLTEEVPREIDISLGGMLQPKLLT